MTLSEFKTLLASEKVIAIILDTDTDNEIDDQFALSYAMLSNKKVNLLSVNAAPFFNSRSSSAAEGMEKSYNEIFNIMKLTDAEQAKGIPVYRGSTRFMSSKTDIVESEACDNIINTVMSSETPVVIVAIGAITNVASAIAKEPAIAEKSAVVWLGGHALERPDTKEFNLRQDIPGAQVLFDSNIPFLQIPCDGVCSSFITTPAELNYYLEGKNELCDYLCSITGDYIKWGYGRSKVVWDVTAIGCMTVPKSMEIVEIPRPFLTSDCRYAFDSARHHYLYVRKIHRDPLYADLFRTISEK
jgi:inosine-uridine nucleoside N-ribohydrolase